MPTRALVATRTSAVVAALALALVAVLAGSARADRLDDARRAIDGVQFEQAQRLLAEALDAGGNSPAAMRELYALSATAAIALGQRDVAEQFYRRWLALDATARVADDVAPKVRDAFAAARAYIAAHGRLAAHVEPSRASPTGATSAGAGALDVVVDADPLAMAAAATAGAAPVPLIGGRARLLVAPRSPAGDARAAAPAAPTRAPDAPSRSSTTDIVIAILDARGNRLVELSPPAVAAAVGEPPPENRAPMSLRAPAEPEVPFAQRWTTWGAPAAAFGIAGAVFGIITFYQHDAIARAVDHSGEHYYSDVDADRRAMERNGTLGIVLGGVGALLAIPAAVFYVRSRRPWSLAPTLGANTFHISFTLQLGDD